MRRRSADATSSSGCCPMIGHDIRLPVAMTRRAELRSEIIRWIEHTYNRRRRQRALGKLTPVEFELAFTPSPCLEAA